VFRNVPRTELLAAQLNPVVGQYANHEIALAGGVGGEAEATLVGEAKLQLPILGS
jgi:hypothetical protein